LKIASERIGFLEGSAALIFIGVVLTLVAPARQLS
jgi:hypothetical protein